METLTRIFPDPGSHYFLLGPRGTGKSTWLSTVHPDALVIDLLDPDLERRLRSRPELLEELVRAHPDPGTVVVDEVQRVPEILDVVHRLIESEKGRWRFILTGSSARKLRRAGVNLLGGRALRRSMHPFVAAELGERFDLGRALVQGLLPLVWDAPDPDDTLRSYVALYLRLEVQTEGLVRNVGSFARFLEAVSFSHAAVINVSDVARECEVNQKTAAGYLEILEDLLLGHRVPVFTRRAKRKVTSHPKFYWFDTGVFRSVRPRGPLDRPEEIAGAALEGLVAQHLRAWVDGTEARPTLHFWRTRAGTEVDFVVYGPTSFTAVEVKHAGTVRPKDLRALRTFGDDYPEATLRFLYRGSRRLVVDGIPCLPVEEYLPGVVPGTPLP